MDGNEVKKVEEISVANARSIAWYPSELKAIIIDQLGDGFIFNANQPSNLKAIPKSEDDSSFWFAEFNRKHGRVLTGETSSSKSRVCWRDNLLNPDQTLLQLDYTDDAASEKSNVFIRNGCLRVAELSWGRLQYGTGLVRYDKSVVAIECSPSAAPFEVKFDQDKQSDGVLYFDAAYIPELGEIVTLRANEKVSDNVVDVEITWNHRDTQSTTWRSAFDVSLSEPVDEFFNRPEFFVDLTEDGNWAAICPVYGNAVLYYLDHKRQDARQLEGNFFSPSRIVTEKTYFRSGGSVFSPGGRHALLGDEDGNAMLYKLKSGGEIRQILRLPTGPVYSRKYSNAKPRVVFSKDGRWLFWLADELNFWDLHAVDVEGSRIAVDCLYEEDIFHYISFPGNSDDRWEWFDSLTPSISNDGKHLALSWMGGWGIVPLDELILREMLRTSNIKR